MELVLWEQTFRRKTRKHNSRFMKIKPFRGIRPPKELVESVSSRPYDVLNSEEARHEAEGNEMSLYHIIKPEINFAPGTDEHDARVYEEALR